MLERATDSRGDDSLIGAILADRYRVERLLGRGGMGAVYLAEHVHMKKAVALKVLHRDMTRLGELVTRFEREAVAAGRVEHPNVAAATDFGRLEDGSFYLVLEYIDGRSLSALLKEGPLQVDRALAITRQIAAGLSAAHAVSIVHRDLKPDNVMLVSQSTGQSARGAAPDHLTAPERVKILDFGIAHVTVADLGDEPITRLGSIMGTAAYMAPEQAIGQAVDARTDIYSLGIILHEMIAGRPPFEGEEAAQVMAKQLTQPPPPLPDGTPAEVAALVSKMLQKSPADRPSDVVAVIEEIDRIQYREEPPPPSAIAAAQSARMTAPAISVAARGAEPVSTRAATVLDVSPQSTENERSRKGLWGFLAVVSVFAFGAFALFSGDDEDKAEAAVPSAAPSAPAPPPPRAAATAASTTRTEGPGTRAALPGAGTATASERVRERNESSSSTTTERDGNTVTRTTKSSSSTSRESVKEQRSVSKKKRKTGPGGIYIPPPSDWF